MSTKRSHILKQIYSFQLQVCSSIVTFKWTPGTEGLMESRKKYIPVEVMIRKVSQVSSCFRIFIWILVLISQCLDISFCFANVICWTGAITFIDFTSGVLIFVFQTEKLLTFLVNHVTAIPNLWWTNIRNLSKNFLQCSHYLRKKELQLNPFMHNVFTSQDF